MISAWINRLLGMLGSLFGYGPKRSPQVICLDKSSISNLPEETFEEQGRGELTWKTLFSHPKTETEELTTGIAVCKPGTGHLCAHRHKQAEIYYIIEGEGLMKIDSKEYQVSEGSVVFIPGDAEHDIRNTHQSLELRWLYVFATDGFGDVHYRFT